MNDTISRQAAIDLVIDMEFMNNTAKGILRDRLRKLPSAQPEYYDYSDIDDVWAYYAKEQDINLTDGAKQLKDAMWVGYRKGKQDAQLETDNFCTDCKEYDQERHFCPRFDRVIKKTVEEMGIIHCKDCKHSELFSDQYLCRKATCWREGDFYCGYAERREDG